MITKTMKQLIEEHNKIALKPRKYFSSKQEVIEQIEYWKTFYSKKPAETNQPVQVIQKPEEKTYTPKQLETVLNLPAIVIRRKLRKLFPEMAKQGTWKVTESMVEKLK